MNKKEVSLEEAKQAADLVAKVELSMTGEIKLAHEMSGRRQAMASIAKLVTVADTIELQRIKESNAFKHLSNPETFESGNVSLFTTWADFCRVIVGCDRKTVDERILNLKTFGQEAIEGMNTLGLGVRQLRQLRKLPDDQLEQAKVLAKEKDVDSLKDLIEEQAVEKAKLKEALEKVEKDKAEDAEATEKLLQKKDEKINKLDKKLNKRAIVFEDWQAQTSETQLEIMHQSGVIKQAMNNIAELREHVMASESIPEQYKDIAHEFLGTSYYAAIKEMTIDVGNLMLDAEQLFGGYNERPIPILEELIAGAKA